MHFILRLQSHHVGPNPHLELVELPIRRYRQSIHAGLAEQGSGTTQARGHLTDQESGVLVDQVGIVRTVVKTNDIDEAIARFKIGEAGNWVKIQELFHDWLSGRRQVVVVDRVIVCGTQPF